MNIVDSLKWRYACKKFDTNQYLSQDQIHILKEAFNLTATSFGLQPVKMLIINNKELQTQLLPHAYNQIQVTTCSHLLVLCIDTQINESAVDQYFDLVKSERQTPDIILGKFKQQLREHVQNTPADKLEQSAINQAYIILGNLMTVCAAEKIDSCPMEGFDSEQFDNILALEKQQLKSVLLLPVGFRAKDDFMSKQKKVRKTINDIVYEL